MKFDIVDLSSDNEWQQNMSRCCIALVKRFGQQRSGQEFIEWSFPLYPQDFADDSEEIELSFVKQSDPSNTLSVRCRMQTTNPSELIPGKRYILAMGSGRIVRDAFLRKVIFAETGLFYTFELPDRTKLGCSLDEIHQARSMEP